MAEMQIIKEKRYKLSVNKKELQLVYDALMEYEYDEENADISARIDGLVDLIKSECKES